MSSVTFASLIDASRTSTVEPLSSLTPVGSVCWIAGRFARMSFATSIRLAFDWRTTPIATEGGLSSERSSDRLRARARRAPRP